MFDTFDAFFWHFGQTIPADFVLPSPLAIARMYLTVASPLTWVFPLTSKPSASLGVTSMPYHQTIFPVAVALKLGTSLGTPNRIQRSPDYRLRAMFGLSPTSLPSINFNCSRSSAVNLIAFLAAS